MAKQSPGFSPNPCQVGRPSHKNPEMEQAWQHYLRGAITWFEGITSIDGAWLAPAR